MDYGKEQLIEMSVTLAEMAGEVTTTIIQKKITFSLQLLDSIGI